MAMENIVGNEAFVRNEQMLHFPQCFQTKSNLAFSFPLHILSCHYIICSKKQKEMEISKNLSFIIYICLCFVFTCLLFFVLKEKSGL